MEVEIATVATADHQRLPDLLELLTALSGHEPEPIDIHEMVLRLEGAGRQDAHLRHYIIPPTAAAANDASRASCDRYVYTYNRNLRH